MLDGNDKIDLELILTLIRHIVLNDEVSLISDAFFQKSVSSRETVSVCVRVVSRWNPAFGFLRFVFHRLINLPKFPS